MAVAAGAPAGAVTVEGRFAGPTGWLRWFWWFMRRYPVIPILVLSLLVVTALAGPTLAPYPRDIGKLEDRHVPPFTRSEKTGDYHLLGTDHIGRDLFSRILYGSRISLMVVGVALTSGFCVGVTLGIVSGYFGGIVDEVITRFVDVWYSLPFLLVALILTLIFGRGLTVLMVVLALIAWTGFVRVLRGQVLVLREADYVAAAKIAGSSPIRIMFRHIFPGVVNTAIVIATLTSSGLILAEATLSFVGAGIQPPTPAWGVMVADGRDYISTAWWQTIMPGIAIFLVVISLNFFGDWLRDRLDPRLRQVD
ncbi:MAG: ABC transporter permease [Chloroflexi bacterium]|nr:ABC transporter permease [Chloroflexota bacterium]